MKKGDLIRNKRDGKFAIVLATYTRFFQESYPYRHSVDYGVAGTAVEIKWLDGGNTHTFQKSKMKANWEIVNENR